MDRRHIDRDLAIKKKIFPPIAHKSMRNLRIDYDSIKFITFYDQAQTITANIAKYLWNMPHPDGIDVNTWNAMPNCARMGHLVITDMTAGVGGNVLNFAKYFSKVNAIELNTLRHKYLINNLQIYNLSENVEFYNGDSIEIIKDLKQDIVFFDPPWGGDSYKLIENMRIVFAGLAIENITAEIMARRYAKMVVLKLPTNYDFTYLSHQLCKYSLIQVNINRIVIIIVRNVNSANT